MTDFSTSKYKAVKPLGKVLSCALCVFTVGLISAPPASAAAVPQVPMLVPASANQPVPVDQQPLTVAEPIPPNIVLMLDDSGSMTSDYMPDGSSHRKPDATRNGVYYNPSVLYSPPPRADPTAQPNRYPDSPGLTNAYKNGFSNRNRNYTLDLTQYNGTFDYYKLLKASQDSKYSPDNGWGCKFGGQPHNGKCKGGLYVFQYVDPTDGETHYVATAGGCAKLTNSSKKQNCLDENDQIVIDGEVTSIGQNVANWFSYYHTRMLMAKSGLMRAFSSSEMKPAYRIGFGSINANRKSYLPSPMYSFNNNRFGGTGYKNNRIAKVSAYGDGSSGTQKSELWAWIDKEYGSGQTPLRLSLKAVGEYYKTDQPWQTSNNDTTKLACRQSYVILTTDGFWNGRNPDMPHSGNVDNRNGDSITGPDGKSGGYVKSAPYIGTDDNTLADVAMYYWNHDLQPQLSNEVPVSGKADPAFWQHMTTFTIGMGYVPTGITPASATQEQIFDWARNGGAPADFSWPMPAHSGINTIADLLHAAVNGHGGFYSATSPQEFAEGLQDALKRISARKGSGASLSASSAALSTDTYVYQVLYHAGDWSGSLYAYKLDANGDPATAAAWSAEAQMPDWDQRNIHTLANGQDVEFKYSNLSADQQAALGDTTDVQKKMVQYLRGKLIEGDDWRARLVLGDIVDSQPIYVAAPDSELYSDSRLDFAGSQDYKAFAEANEGVTPVLYVAANDGMLHGFNADTGEETYAYLPAAVIVHGSETGDHHISQVADPDYGYQNGGLPHQYFNDGELTVADVYMDNNWKVVLVGTTGRGHAKAVYALDVTDPENVTLMWEKSAYSTGCANCAYIGQMTSKPIIAQVADGQWAVLMGNGYNSEKNQAALLQFSLADGTLHVHTAGIDSDNGLSGAAIWVADSTNNISTVAYAGDLEGHVWSFPLNTNDLATADTAGSVLFTATDAGGDPQPITAALAVQQDAATGKRWVFFGTGQYLSSVDADNVSSKQTWYGLIINDEDGNEVAAGTRDNLVQRKIVSQGTDSNGDLGRAISKASEVDEVDTYGWYVDLSDAGERMVVANRFNGSLLYGTSIIPNATNVCDPSGSGWVMAIDPFTGTNPTWDVLGSTITTGADGNTPAVTRNTSGVHFGSMPNGPIFVGGNMMTSTSSGKVKKKDLKPPAGAGRRAARISWREVISR